MNREHRVHKRWCHLPCGYLSERRWETPTMCNACVAKKVEGGSRTPEADWFDWKQSYSYALDYLKRGKTIDEILDRPGYYPGVTAEDVILMAYHGNKWGVLPKEPVAAGTPEGLFG